MMNETTPDLSQTARREAGTAAAGPVAAALQIECPDLLHSVDADDPDRGQPGQPCVDEHGGACWSRWLMWADFDGAAARQAMDEHDEAVASALLGERDRLEDEGGWTPVDLGGLVRDIAAGAWEPAVPTVGRLFAPGAENCPGLFYPGEVNSIHGDPDCGKTWTALICCAQEMLAGRTALFIDYEDGPRRSVPRLMHSLHVPAEVVEERFIYLNPEEPLTKEHLTRLTGWLESARPSLVVIDSVGEALALEGRNEADGGEVAMWFRLLPRTIADMGACVVVLDHLPKDAGGKALWPIGSQRKRAVIRGASYLQHVVKPFSAEQAGYAVLTVAKDKPATRTQGEDAAHLQVGNGEFTLVAAPDKKAREARAEKRQQEAERETDHEIMTALIDAAAGLSGGRGGGWLTTREVTEATAARPHVKAAKRLDALVEAGRVERAECGDECVVCREGDKRNGRRVHYRALRGSRGVRRDDS